MAGLRGKRGRLDWWELDDDAPPCGRAALPSRRR